MTATPTATQTPTPTPSQTPTTPPPPRGALLVVFLTVFIDLLGFGIVLPVLPRQATPYLDAIGMPPLEGGAGGAVIGVLFAGFVVIMGLHEGARLDHGRDATSSPFNRSFSRAAASASPQTVPTAFVISIPKASADGSQPTGGCPSRHP